MFHRLVDHRTRGVEARSEPSLAAAHKSKPSSELTAGPRSHAVRRSGQLRGRVPRFCPLVAESSVAQTGRSVAAEEELLEHALTAALTAVGELEPRVAHRLYVEMQRVVAIGI